MGGNWAIILAAGKGKRMGAHKNKQFLEIKGKPLLFYTLKVFSQNAEIDQIILVVAKNEIEDCKRIIEQYKIKKVFAIVEGGEERQNSVLNGLEAITNGEIVLIHDGARPFVSDKIIKDGIKFAKLYKAAACGVIPKDTIKNRDEKGFSSRTYNRNNLFVIQTPQCFEYAMILDCHKNLIQDKISVTDDTMVVEQYGNKVYLYEGSYTNIKITTSEDLLIGEKILEMDDEYNYDK